MTRRREARRRGRCNFPALIDPLSERTLDHAMIQSVRLGSEAAVTFALRERVLDGSRVIATRSLQYVRGAPGNVSVR